MALDTIRKLALPVTMGTSLFLGSAETSPVKAQEENRNPIIQTSSIAFKLASTPRDLTHIETNLARSNYSGIIDYFKNKGYNLVLDHFDQSLPQKGFEKYFKTYFKRLTELKDSGILSESDAKKLAEQPNKYSSLLALNIINYLRENGVSPETMNRAKNILFLYVQNSPPIVSGENLKDAEGFAQKNKIIEYDKALSNVYTEIKKLNNLEENIIPLLQGLNPN
jgi:hypothetical protein